MQISQMAPRNYQASHYTFIATIEVLGKLSFASVIGFIADFTGYNVAFGVFVLLSIFTLQMLYGETNI